MRRSSGDPVGGLEELRRLLLSGEREQLRDLRERISDKERRSQDVASVLPEAVKRSRERGDELARALRPAVEGSIKESIEKRPETFVESLHPIIGPIVRRSLAESLRRLLQSLNQTLEHTFSWRGLKWRFEALRTGKSFAEVVMLRSLVYRVEQLFLIHRETGLSLLHVAADPDMSKDSDMVAGMLSAIQDFARDSFAAGEDSALEEFRVGELQVWIAPGRSAYLAAVIRGNPSREFRTTLEDAIDSIHVMKGSALAKFEGDPSVFESLRPELESCLHAQYAATKKDKRPVRAWVMILLAAAAATAGLVVAWRSDAKWKDFLGRLKTQPGLVVTDAHKGWFAPSRVSGLRDASSVDPAVLAREAQVDPARIHFSWKDFLALDPASVMRRFKNRFGIPTETQATIKDGVLTLAGSTPFEWLDHVRHEATLVPGVTSIDDHKVAIKYDPDLARQRFEKQLGLPETANAVVLGGGLTLSGEASHRWLARVRTDAVKLPGIVSVDDRGIVDLDKRAFEQSKAIIEHAFVYFLLNKDDIATEGFTALSRLPDELRRCETAAKRLDDTIILEIDGYADAVGDAAKNADLSQRRANKVRDFLLSCGFDSAMLRPIGKGAPPKLVPGQAAAPEQSDRRVAFKVKSSRVLSP